jgi:hypothetical protein
MKSTRDEERRGCAGDARAQDSPLTPELKDFIKRILVPILVERYIKDSKKASPESDGVVQ